LSQDRLLLCQCGIANIKLNKKRLVFPGLSILGGERVPPPIISVVRQGAMQHAGVPCDIVMIKHVVLLFLLQADTVFPAESTV
jgi:hypothetical protein